MTINNNKYINYRKNTYKNKMKKYHISERGIAFLKELSGYTNIPKIDSYGNYIVGLGHKVDISEIGTVYSDDDLKKFFNDDKIKYEDDVNKIFDDRFMDQNMFDACFFFAFDIGNISNTDLGHIIAKNPYDDSLREFWRYTYTNGYKNKAMIDRRRKEVRYYFSEI